MCSSRKTRQAGVRVCVRVSVSVWVRVSGWVGGWVGVCVAQHDVCNSNSQCGMTNMMMCVSIADVNEKFAPPIIGMPGQFPVYLRLPYRRDYYFCFRQDARQAEFLSILSDCIRHQNQGN